MVIRTITTNKSIDMALVSNQLKWIKGESKPDNWCDLLHGFWFGDDNEFYLSDTGEVIYFEWDHDIQVVWGFPNANHLLKNESLSMCTRKEFIYKFPDKIAKEVFAGLPNDLEEIKRQ